MRKLNYLVKLNILILAIIALFPLQVLALAQITKPIVIDNALRGQEFSQTLTLINSKDQEEIVELMAESDIEEWVSFYEEDDLDNAIEETILEPNGKKKIIAAFNIPEDIANGEYVGRLSVMNKPDIDKSDGDVVTTIKQKIARNVTINVTDKEVIDFTASIIPEKYDLDLGETFNLRIVYHNQSNIIIKPQVQITIKQGEKVFYNVIHPYPEEKGVKPLATHEIPKISVPISEEVKEGKVRAEIDILHNDEVIQEKRIHFNLGSAPEDEKEPAGLNKGLYAIGIIIIITIVVVFSILYLGKRTNTRSRK
ncbi:MAG: hypothetical protein ABIG10_02520 [bacterium]